MNKRKMKETTKQRVWDFIAGLLIASCLVGFVAYGIVIGEQNKEEEFRKDHLQIDAQKDRVNQTNIAINDTLKVQYGLIIHPMKKRK